MLVSFFRERVASSALARQADMVPTCVVLDQAESHRIACIKLLR